MTSSSSPRGSGTVTPSTTHIVSQQVSAVDITSSFTEAASKLTTGQLVKDEYFTLFEAVGALEIGDAKMDSGFLEPGETMDDTYDVLRDLLPAEVIGLMDQMLCQEVAWHRGHALSQTLFTSIYIDRLLWPEPILIEQAQFSRSIKDNSRSTPIHDVLRAYCLGMIKACDFVISKITSEHYYEEEDFSSQTFNRSLLHRFDASEIQVLLDNALSWLEASDIIPDIRNAIEKRLIFREELLTALEADTGNAQKRRGNDFKSCALLLQEIKSTTHLGISVPDAFSSKIQRRLASSVPPRPIVTVDYETAFAFLERLCHDGSDVDQLLRMTTNNALLTAATTFMARKPQPSVYIRALLQSFVYHADRALGNKSLKEFIFGDLDALVLPDSLLLQVTEDLSNGEDGASYTTPPATLLEDFVRRVGLTYINMFRTICLNRSRYRRTLCHAVIDWDSIQADAEDIDTSMRDFTNEEPLVYTTSPDPTFAYPLSSWMYHYKLLQLQEIIQMGFELSVYALDELPSMYWYLSHICTTHLSHLDRIGFFVESEGKRRNTSPHQLREPLDYPTDTSAKLDETVKNLDRHFINVRASDALSRALHLLYTVLNRHGLLPTPSRPYSTDKLRYELRMKPFLPLSIPEPVTFENFQHESTLSQVNDEDVLDAATQSVSEARKGWEDVLATKWMDESIDDGKTQRDGGTSIEADWTKNVKNTIRACIATSIAVATTKKKLEEVLSSARSKKAGIGRSQQMSGLKVEVALAGEKGCWHDWWIVPKISG